MIISRTPLRISFIGGGSDLSSFYQSSPGAVISTTINKYIYITVNRKFDHRIRASYSITEIVDHVDELKHELIRESLKLAGIYDGIEITSISDVPSEGTGLGSSSTYTVGLLKALYAFRGHNVSAERLAREACEIEIHLCGKPIGKQDQYIAAYGGLQYMRFHSDESVYVDPIILSAKIRHAFHSHLLLFYTGLTRSSNEILSEQRANTESNTEHRQALKHLVDLTNILHADLLKHNLDRFGDILHEGWQTKKRMACGISNESIDTWYDQARRAGAIGGKILGAGGGGFLLLYAHPEHHYAIRNALSTLRYIDFDFEPQGSKIVYVED